MSRSVGFLMVGLAIVVGCGKSEQAQPPTTTVIDLGTPAKTDPTPVLPIPDDAPGASTSAAEQAPIKPIPDDPATSEPAPQP